MTSTLEEPRTTTEPPATTPVQAEQLFDTTRYNVDKASLKFSGQVGIDLSDERFIQLFKGLTPGRDHKLTIEVRVSQYTSKFGEDDGGYVDAVAGTKTINVHTIYPADEQ